MAEGKAISATNLRTLSCKGALEGKSGHSRRTQNGSEQEQDYGNPAKRNIGIGHEQCSKLHILPIPMTNFTTVHGSGNWICDTCQISVSLSSNLVVSTNLRSFAKLCSTSIQLLPTQHCWTKSFLLEPMQKISIQIKVNSFWKSLETWNGIHTGHISSNYMSRIDKNHWKHYNQNITWKSV